MCGKKKGNNENENRPSKSENEGYAVPGACFHTINNIEMLLHSHAITKMKVSFMKQTSPLHNRSVERSRWVQDVRDVKITKN